MMVRWMCGVTLKNKKSSEELKEYLGIESVTDVVRCERLRLKKGIDVMVKVNSLAIQNESDKLLLHQV